MRKYITWSALVCIIMAAVAGKIYAQSGDPQLDVFARKFLQALITENPDSILALKPGQEVWRKVMPQETAKMKDEEIIKTVNSNEKFYNDFNNIMASYVI